MLIIIPPAYEGTGYRRIIGYDGTLYQGRIAIELPESMAIEDEPATATRPARSRLVFTGAPDGAVPLTAQVLGSGGISGGGALSGAPLTFTLTPPDTTPSTIQPDASASSGASATAAAADHRHAIVCAAPGAIVIGDSAAEGVATSFARADHVHSLAAPSAPATIGTSASTGVSSAPARADHVHAHGAQSDGGLHAAAVASVGGVGGTNGFITADDQAKINAIPTAADYAAWAAQTEWVIDSATGSDSAVGDSGTPLETLTEWVRRMSGAVIQVAMTVSIVGDLDGDDNPSGTIRVGASGSVTIDGTAGITSLHTGTFTTANACVPSTNTPWSATDTGLSGANDWATYIDTAFGASTGARVRVTSGANAGVIMWPALNLGSKSVRLSQPMIPDPSLSMFGQSLGSIANTDPYVVERLPQLSAMTLRFEIQNAGSGLEQVVFNALRFAGNTVISTNVPYALAAYGCDLSSGGFVGGCGYVNCRHAGTAINQGDIAVFCAGLSTQSITCPVGITVIIDQRHMIQCDGFAGVFSYGGNTVYLASVQVFNPNAVGDGLLARFGTGMYLAPYLGSSEIFGTSTRYGLYVMNGCIAGIDSVTGKTITGGTGSVKVGSIAVAAWSGANQPVSENVTTAGSAKFAALLIQ